MKYLVNLNFILEQLLSYDIKKIENKHGVLLKHYNRTYTQSISEVLGLRNAVQIKQSAKILSANMY